MTAKEEVIKQALELDEEGRAEVAARLLESLEQQDAAAEAAWTAELERRAEDLESGAVEGISWEELQLRLRREQSGS